MGEQSRDGRAPGLRETAARQRGRTTRLFRRVLAAELRSMRWAGRGAGQLVTGVARRLYYLKYDVIAAWLGLPARIEQGRGLLIVQIDALSYTHLHEAMRRGYAPYLKRLLAGGEFRLHEWRCGLPSATPAVQAGIMYGDNRDIPAFRWYDKALAREVVCKTPGLLGAIQHRLAGDHVGLLRGGSSYVNLFSGDASLSLFSLASFGRNRYFEQARGDRLVRVFLISPLRLGRMAVLAAWEYLLHQIQATLVRLRRVDRIEGASFALVRIICNVLFKEVQTFASMVDAYRGVPRIMTDYNGYDEMAHHFGPLATPTLRELRSIDRRIRDIDRIRRYSPYRSYDLYVISDHGQTPSTPFRHRFGQGFHAYVHSLIGQSLAAEIARLDHFDAENIATYVVDELRPLLRSPDASWLRRRILGSLVRLLDRRLSRFDDIHQPGPLPVYVSNSSSLANIYFNHRIDRVPWEEIEARYPHLIVSLVAHPGIQVLIGRRAGGDLVVAGKKGRLTISDGECRLEGEHPLASVEDPAVAVRQVVELASYPHSGDLIVFSAYSEQTDRVINFEEQLGGHGALGGPQARPFIMCPAHVDLDVSGVTSARQLYPFFMAHYGAPAAETAAHQSAPPANVAVAGAPLS